MVVLTWLSYSISIPFLDLHLSRLVSMIATIVAIYVTSAYLKRTSTNLSVKFQSFTIAHHSKLQRRESTRVFYRTNDPATTHTRTSPEPLVVFTTLLAELEHLRHSSCCFCSPKDLYSGEARRSCMCVCSVLGILVYYLWEVPRIRKNRGF